MVFCKLSNGLKNKLQLAETSVENTITSTKNIVNQNVQKNLSKIERMKTSLSNQIQQKIQRQKDKIQKNIIGPYVEKKKQNYAILFIVDICLSIVAGLFIYKLYPFFKHYFSKENYTTEQYKTAKNLPEDAYSKEDLRKVKEFRDSFQGWIDYYKQDNAFSPDNVGLPEIQRGSVLRQPMLFVIQYVIPYVIVAYMVWFVVKYIKYVLAAIWGFFVAVYQFVTEKITCKLAEKWYIRLVTGWSTCNPNFSQYVDNWKTTYVTRPLAKERIAYLRGVQQAKTLYQSKKATWDYDWKFDWSFGLLSLWNFLGDWKRIYIDLPIEELYLQIIGFHPTYVVQPYEIIAAEGDKRQKKLTGQAYPSKTKKGKICKCPPRKTVMKKLTNFLQAAPKIDVKKTVSGVDKTLQNIRSSIRIPSGVKKKIGNLVDSVGDCQTLDNIAAKRKTIAKAIWTSMMVSTTGIIVYSILYGSPGWLSNLTNPVYQFTNGYTPSATVATTTIVLALTYLGTFTGLGYYGFFH